MATKHPRLGDSQREKGGFVEIENRAPGKREEQRVGGPVVLENSEIAGAADQKGFHLSMNGTIGPQVKLRRCPPVFFALGFPL